MTYTLYLLTVLTDWIGFGLAFVLGAIGAYPVIRGWIQSNKYSKKSGEMLREMKRRTEVSPEFEIYGSYIPGDNRIVFLRNVGATACRLFTVATGTMTIPSLVLDKHEIINSEVLSIYFGDSFQIFHGETLQICIGFADVDDIRYQQIISKSYNALAITLPQILR